MRWPWSRRRRKEAAAVAVESSGFQPGSWAQSALPPIDEVGDPALRNAASGHRVRLGFADGTSVEVEESSIDSQALQAVVGKFLSE